MKGVRAESDGGRIRCVGSDASWDISIISSAGVGTGLPQGLRCGTLCKGLGISLIGEYCTNCKALYKDVSAFWRVMRNRLIFTSLSPSTEDYIVLRPLSHFRKCASLPHIQVCDHHKATVLSRLRGAESLTPVQSDISDVDPQHDQWDRPG